MRRGTAVLTGVAVAAALVVPAVGSVAFARHDAVQEVEREAHFYAADALHRSNATTAQVDADFSRLTAAGARCDPAGRALMRDLDVSSSYVQAIGVVRSGQLVCSSLTGTEEPIALGPVDYVSPSGAVVRTDVQLPFAPESAFIVVERDGYAAVVHKALPIDVTTSQDGVGLALVSRPGNRVLARSGNVETAWYAGSTRSRDFLDDGRAVSLAVSDDFFIATVAGLPRSALGTAFRESAERLVPPALVAGLLLAVAVLLLARRRAALPAEIRVGLRRREFRLEYQPVVDLATRQVVGAEALLRWRRPSGLEPPPDLFVKAAERAGIVQDLTKRVLELLAHDAPELVRAAPGLHLSVNLAAADVHDPVTVQRVAAAAALLPRGQLAVEITERAVVDPDRAAPVLAQLRDLGVQIAVDDFGTGYSSLASLQHLDVDVLKIDKTFVDALGTEAATAGVVPHVVQMARALSLRLVAEGVETEEQARRLAELGVGHAQGWLFGRAVAPDVLAAVLRDADGVPLASPQPT